MAMCVAELPTFALWVAEVLFPVCPRARLCWATTRQSTWPSAPHTPKAISPNRKA